MGILNTIEFLVLITALFAGSIASVAGFGIGSILTPVLSLSVGTKLAVALVSLPHFIATAIRFWMLRSHIDKQVLLRFGVMSALGSLVGALLNSSSPSPALTLIFGLIISFTGLLGITNLSEKMRFHGRMAWVAGFLSGLLGGLVGNQGGIRAAAMLGFNIHKNAFIATATATGLIVDATRMPVYFWSQGESILNNGRWIAIMTIGVAIGTISGAKILKALPEKDFRKLVSTLILALGLFMIGRGLKDII